MSLVFWSGSLDVTCASTGKEGTRAGQGTVKRGAGVSALPARAHAKHAATSEVGHRRAPQALATKLGLTEGSGELGSPKSLSNRALMCPNARQQACFSARL